jgi:hypothetical protein
MDVEGERAVVAIVGDGLDALVGQNGAVLEAVQELTRLAVVRETGVRSRLMLDIGGWRAGPQGRADRDRHRAARGCSSPASRCGSRHDAVRAQGRARRGRRGRRRRSASPRASSPSAVWWSCPPDGRHPCGAARRAEPAPPSDRPADLTPPAAAHQVFGAACRCSSATRHCWPDGRRARACSARARRRGSGTGTCSTAPGWPSCSRRCGRRRRRLRRRLPGVVLRLPAAGPHRRCWSSRCCARHLPRGGRGRLGLRTAVVRRRRAEELAGSQVVDVVVARAVAPARPAGRLVPAAARPGRPAARAEGGAGGQRAGHLPAGAHPRRCGRGRGGGGGRPRARDLRRVVVVTRGTGSPPKKAARRRA